MLFLLIPKLALPGNASQTSCIWVVHTPTKRHKGNLPINIVSTVGDNLRIGNMEPRRVPRCHYTHLRPHSIKYSIVSEIISIQTLNDG
jgi:hypothetical protein